MDTAADLPLPGSGSGADLNLPPPVFEDYYSRLPSDELRSELKQLGQELEDAHDGRFRADNLTLPLRQKIFKFLHSRVDPADPTLQGLILHEPPKAEPEWDLTLSGFLPFLLRPPQPNAAQAAGPDAASRQRVGRSVDAAAGQQSRGFTGYDANRPMPISNADGEPAHILCMTTACKDSQRRQIGTYRGVVCVMIQEERPDGGRDWRKVKLQLRGDGGESEGWVDVSLALGVLEPQQSGRKRARRGSAAAAAGSGSSGPAQPDPAAAAAAAGSSGTGSLADAIANTTAAAAAAAGAAAAGMSVLPGMPFAAAGGLLPSATPAPLSEHFMPGPHMASTTAGCAPVSMQAFVPGWQHLAFTAGGGGGVGWAPSSAEVAPVAAGGLPGLLLGVPQPTSAPAAAAALPAPLAAVAAPADSTDDLVSMLDGLRISRDHQQLSAKLLTACRAGQDLVQVLVPGQGGAQQQQEAKSKLLQLLRGEPIVDNYGRNLLHLVATHSFGVPHAQRLQQLQLLLSVDEQLGHRLSRAVNNNGSTPLMLAAGSGLKGRGDAEVFSRLLTAADAVVLAKPTKSGWRLLHCLAHAAEIATAPAVAELLEGLMHETVRRVRELAQEVRAGGGARATAAADLLEELCLRSQELQGPRYAGRVFMQQLQV